VILQTYNPDHPVVQAAQAQNYQSFLESEYQERQALHYPPFGKLVAFGWQGRHEEIVIACAQQWAQQLLAVGGQVLGPAPALIPKVRQEYRWQLLWKLDQPPQPLLKGLEQHLPPGISRRLDIDPIQFW
jgi:primosomal protein N' (replication factor Y)